MDGWNGCVGTELCYKWGRPVKNNTTGFAVRDRSPTDRDGTIKLIEGVKSWLCALETIPSFVVDAIMNITMIARHHINIDAGGALTVGS